MVTWEECKVKFEKGPGSAPKVEELKELRKEDTDPIMLLEERIKVENERWGTPEKAYNTWESRARAIVDIANEHSRQLREQSDVAVKTYGNMTFKTWVYSERRVFLGGKKWVRKPFGNVSISEFSLVFKPDGGFYLARNGEQVPMTDITDNTTDGPRLNLGEYVENHWAFERAISSIFDPLVQATILERGDSLYDVRKFFELGQKLKQAKDYKFSCAYFKEGIEDDHTELVFDTVSVIVHNPFYRDNLLYHIIPLAGVSLSYIMPKRAF